MNTLTIVQMSPNNVSCISAGIPFPSFNTINLSDGVHPVYFNKKIFKVLLKNSTNDCVSISFFDKISAKKVNEIIDQGRLVGLCIEKGVVQGLLVSSKWYNTLPDNLEISVKSEKNHYSLIEYDVSIWESQKYSTMAQKTKEIYGSSKINSLISSLPSQQHSSSIEKLSLQQEQKAATSPKSEIDPNKEDSNANKATSQFVYIYNRKTKEMYMPCSLLEKNRVSPSSMQFHVSNFPEDFRRAFIEVPEAERPQLNLIGVPDEEWPEIYDLFLKKSAEYVAKIQQNRLVSVPFQNDLQQINTTAQSQSTQKPIPSSNPRNPEKTKADVHPAVKQVTNVNPVPVNPKKQDPDCAIL